MLEVNNDNDMVKPVHEVARESRKACQISTIYRQLVPISHETRYQGLSHIQLAFDSITLSAFANLMMHSFPAHAAF